MGGVAKCECDNPTCADDETSVCGSDGRTYPSECDLQKEQCARRMTINAIKNESCGESVIIVKKNILVCLRLNVFTKNLYFAY